MKNLKIQVEKILEENLDTRNSDITLMIKLWKRYYPQYIKFSEKWGVDGVLLRDLYKLPTQDLIKRIRAKLQNEEHRYLPTSWIIAKKRKINEEKWKNFALENYKPIGLTLTPKKDNYLY